MVVIFWNFFFHCVVITFFFFLLLERRRLMNEDVAAFLIQDADMYLYAMYIMRHSILEVLYRQSKIPDSQYSIPVAVPGLTLDSLIVTQAGVCRKTAYRQLLICPIHVIGYHFTFDCSIDCSKAWEWT